MKTKIIAIGILAMIAICATVAMAAVETQIYMTPDTLMLNTGGNYVTAFLYADELGDINPEELILTDDPNVGINNISAEKVYYDPDKEDYDYAVKFSREKVIEWQNEETGTVRLYVVYQGPDGVDVIGYDDFIVMNSNEK
jgi:hypothetical protein